MIHKLLKRPQAIIGLCLIAIVIVIAIAAPAFSPHDPELVNLSQKYAQPDAEYPLGTDQLGRCTLSRLLYGARYSIGISLPVLLILSVIGLIVGTFSACAGKKADHFITIPMMTVSWRRTELLSPFISTILRALQVLTMQFFLLQLLLKNSASMLLLMQ